LSSIPL